MLVCDKCSAQISAGAKFCSQCGDPVTSADVASPAIAADHTAKISISFGYSSSQNYPTAVEICSRIPSYEVEGENRDAVHSIILDATDVKLAIRVWDLVGNWKSANMLIDGVSATKSNLVYGGLGCYQTRQQSFRPEQYCFGEREYDFNVWGCKRLNMPIYQWGGGWLDFGALSSDGVWHFDKDRIRLELEGSIHENRHCPVLSKARVLETLDMLPDSVDPRRDPHWEYNTQPDFQGDDYREVIVGIRPVMKQATRYVAGDFAPVLEEEVRSDHILERPDEPA